MYAREQPLLLCVLCGLETVRLFRLFSREGDMENTGFGSTEHRGLQAKVLP
jgi:hypothetical protein